MTTNRKLAFVVMFLLLAAALFSALIVHAYLPEHSGAPILSLLLMVASLPASLVAYRLVSRLPGSPGIRRAVIIGLVAIVGVPLLASPFIHKITYARFGFTVYGLLPIPALDITVNRNGLLWFREKTHRITHAIATRPSTASSRSISRPSNSPQVDIT